MAGTSAAVAGVRRGRHRAGSLLRRRRTKPNDLAPEETDRQSAVEILDRDLQRQPGLAGRRRTGRLQQHHGDQAGERGQQQFAGQVLRPGPAFAAAGGVGGLALRALRNTNSVEARRRGGPTLHRPRRRVDQHRQRREQPFVLLVVRPEGVRTARPAALGECGRGEQWRDAGDAAGGRGVEALPVRARARRNAGAGAAAGASARRCAGARRDFQLQRRQHRRRLRRQHQPAHALDVRHSGVRPRRSAARAAGAPGNATRRWRRSTDFQLVPFVEKSCAPSTMRASSCGRCRPRSSARPAIIAAGCGGAQAAGRQQAGQEQAEEQAAADGHRRSFAQAGAQRDRLCQRWQLVSGRGSGRARLRRPRRAAEALHAGRYPTDSSRAGRAGAGY